jgi:hypothetical protein
MRLLDTALENQTLKAQLEAVMGQRDLFLAADSTSDLEKLPAMGDERLLTMSSAELLALVDALTQVRPHVGTNEVTVIQHANLLCASHAGDAGRARCSGGAAGLHAGMTLITSDMQLQCVHTSLLSCAIQVLTCTRSLDTGASQAGFQGIQLVVVQVIVLVIIRVPCEQRLLLG